MYVEPVRPLSPARRSRLRGLLAVAAPVVALVAVVGVATVAGRPGDEPAGPLPSLAAAADAARESEPAPAPHNPQALEDVDFPDRAARLPVRSAAAILERRRAGDVGDELVAVSGWLTVPPRQRACSPEVNPAAAWSDLCRRRTILTDRPASLFSVPDGLPSWRGNPEPHLHPEVMPGTSLANLADRPFRTLEEAVQPVPVVVVGRFDDPRVGECLGESRHCGESFVLERLVWVDGAWPEIHVVRGPGVGPDDRRLGIGRFIVRESARSPIVLTQALVAPVLLERIDPAAAQAVASLDDDLVWYVRTVGREPWTASGPRVRWAVADAGGRILAAGTAGTAGPAAAAAPR